MNCPKCGSKAKVIDSRPYESYIIRRRECNGCKHRFTTYEISLREYEDGKQAINTVKQVKELIGLTERRKFEI